jgi:hypothetical protein
MRKLGGAIAVGVVLVLLFAAWPAIAQQPAPPATRLTGEPRTPDTSGRVKDARTLDSGWPPVLVVGALVLAGSAGGVIVVMMRRARAALRATSGPR